MRRSTKTTSKKATSAVARAPACSAALALLLRRRSAARGAADRRRRSSTALANARDPILQDKSLDRRDQKRDRIEEIAYAAMDFRDAVEAGAGAQLVEVLARAAERVPARVQAPSVGHLRAQRRQLQATRRCRSSASARRRAATSSVQTKILRGGRSDGRRWSTTACARRDGQWKIIDVIVEGVSLVSNFRSQFQDIVSNGGPDRLLVLREKNAQRRAAGDNPRRVVIGSTSPTGGLRCSAPRQSLVASACA